MKNYSYLKKLNLEIKTIRGNDFVSAQEMNEKVQLLVIKNTELLHALRQIRIISTDYNYKTRLQDILSAVHEVAKRNLGRFGEDIDR